MAVTPIPPAVHTEIRPRFALLSFESSFARLATMRVPVAANGWPTAMLPPFTFSFDRSMLPSGPGRPSTSRQYSGVSHAFKRAEHLRGEGLVNLVVVEVLQRRGRHLSALPARRRRAP